MQPMRECIRIADEKFIFLPMGAVCVLLMSKRPSSATQLLQGESNDSSPLGKSESPSKSMVALSSERRDESDLGDPTLEFCVDEYRELDKPSPAPPTLRPERSSRPAKLFQRSAASTGSCSCPASRWTSCMKSSCVNPSVRAAFFCVEDISCQVRSSSSRTITKHLVSDRYRA